MATPLWSLEAVAGQESPGARLLAPVSTGAAGPAVAADLLLAGSPPSATLVATSTLGASANLDQGATATLAATSTLGATGYLWYRGEVLADTPALWLRLGESSGTTAADSSGNSRNGTYAGSPSLGVGGALASDTDTACTFNGSSQSVSVPYNSGWLNPTTYSVEAWYKATATGIIVARDVVGSDWLLSTNVTNGLEFRVTFSTTSATAGTGTGVPYADGNWHHAVGTWDGTTARVYFDGVIGSLTGTGTGTRTAGTTALTVARRGTSSPAYLAGSIDEVAFYSGQVLSASRIAAHHASGLIVAGDVLGTASLSATSTLGAAGTREQFPTATLAATSTLFATTADPASLEYGVQTKGALVYWKQSESSGTSAADSSGHGITGTYAGSPTFGQPNLVVGDPGAVGYSTSGTSLQSAQESSLTTAAWSYETWLRSTYTSRQDAANRWGGSGASRFQLVGNWITTGRIVAQCDNTLQFIESSVAVNDGVRHHVVLTQSASTLTIYVDGVNRGSVSSTPSITIGNLGTLVVGSNNSGFSNWQGDNGHSAYYGRALSSTEVADNFLRGTSVGAVAALSATSTLGAAATIEEQATATLVATSTLSAVAFLDQAASATLAATSDLSANGTVILGGVGAVLTATSSLAVSAFTEMFASALLAATSSLTASAAVAAAAVATLVATSTLFADATVSAPVGSSATVTIPTGAGTTYYVRVISASPTSTDGGTLTWSSTPRAGYLVLEDLTGDVSYTPIWIRISLANGIPGDVVALDVDGTSLSLSVTLDEAGQQTGVSVLLPALTAGSHTLTATGSSSSGSVVFSVLAAAVSYPSGLAPDNTPTPVVQTGVVKWIFQDPAPGGESYLFPINPARMSTPRSPRVFTMEHTTAPDGQPLVFEGQPIGTDWTIEGTVLTQAFYEKLEAFATLGRVFLIDHLSRAWTVTVEKIDWTQYPAQGNPWAYRYTMRLIITDGPVQL